MYHYARAVHGPRPCFDGIRAGRTEKTPAGEVVVSTLSAAELAEFNTRVPPVQATRRPIETAGERLLRKQQKEGSTMAKHTKEEFLQLRADGLSVVQIASEWGMKTTPLYTLASQNGWTKPKQTAGEERATEEPVNTSVAEPVSPVYHEEDDPLPDAFPGVQQTPDAVQETVQVVQEQSDPERQMEASSPEEEPHASVSLLVYCPRCKTRHFVQLRILSNPRDDEIVWWGMCPISEEPILAAVDVQAI
ncbi:MAG: hypothetical protein ACYCYO_02115 [Bacilli bacterium]